MATGMQVWSKTAASNNSIDTSVNWAEGMAPSAVNNSARAEMASVAMWRDDNNGTLVTTGSSAAFTVTSNQVEGALTDGYTIAVRLHATCDSSATLAVDGLTAKPIQRRPGIGIGFGQIRNGTVCRFTYSSTGTGQWLLQSGADHTPGDIVWAARSANPDELACDGTGYSRTTYADLFAAIGTTYGSSDVSSFKVPDIGGRTIAGKEATATRLTTAVSGVDGGTLGATGGAQSVTLDATMIPSHTHTATVTDPGHVHSENIQNQVAGAQNHVQYVTNIAGDQASSSQTASAVTGITVANSNTGGGGAHSNVQPTIVLNAFIKI